MRAGRSACLAVLAAAAAAAPAQAHVQVTPAEAAPGDPVQFELLVPGESDAHTTEVALQIPKGVLPFSFEDQPGWKRTIEPADDGSAGVVRWRGRLASDGFVRFAFLAATPEREGQLAWKAVQRYDDGEEAAWIGPPDSDNPAAVTTISASAPRQNAGGEGADASRPRRRRRRRAPAARRSRMTGDGSGTLGIVLGAGGLVLGAAALVVALRRRPREATREPALLARHRPGRAPRGRPGRTAHDGNPNYLSQVDRITPATQTASPSTCSTATTASCCTTRAARTS